MAGFRHTLATLVLVMPGLLGCTTFDGRPANTPPVSPLATPTSQPSAPSPTAPSADVPAPPVTAAPVRTSPGTPQPTAQPVPASTTAAPPTGVAEILAQLPGTNELDAATKAQLAADLEHTDPSLWPLLVEQLKATLAYRQKHSPAQNPPGQTAISSPAPQRSAQPITQAGSEKPVGSNLKRPPLESLKVAHTLKRSDASAAPIPEPEPKLQPEAPAITRTAAQVSTRPAAASSSRPPAQITPDAKLARPLKANQPGQWQTHLGAAVADLELQTKSPPATADEVHKQATLRMLYVAQGQREAALQPIVGIPPAQQDFWSKQLYALSAYLDHERNPDASRRAAEAKLHLNDAAARLGELATLQVRNAVFCTEVSSYGVYKKFDKYEFQPGQEILLYAEVENFKSESGDKGFHTALKGSYQILDPKGTRVAEQQFPVAEEYCQNQRRDYFTRYFVWLPKRIYNGAYTLQLTIEDTLSQKLGQASIEFSIKENASP